MTDAVVESQIATLAQLPSHVAGRFPGTSVRRCTPDGYDEMSGREFFEQIRDVSLGLAALGVCPGDRVALICETRPEWLLSDLGTLCAGAVAVPIYPTLPPSLVGFILKDAGVETVIASDEEQADKVRQVKGEVPQLREYRRGGAGRSTSTDNGPRGAGQQWRPESLSVPGSQSGASRSAGSSASHA